MGRSTSGVTGMKFRADDSLLAMAVLPAGEDPDVFVVFENGMAKRSAASQWTPKGRAGLGVKVADLTERNGDLAGALTVDEEDEVLVVFAKGNLVRVGVSGVTRRSRNTQGMTLVKPGKGDRVVAIARNPERDEEVVPPEVQDAQASNDAVASAETDDDGGKA